MLSKFLSRFGKSAHPDQGGASRKPITVVSGLPRSGTSMMMQILQAGGMTILTDQERSADEDNPKGYFELERVKKLKEGDAAWVDQAQGKVVKVISALLEHLPAQYEYKVIFMQRKMEEVLASQKQMLIRRGEATDKANDETLALLFQQHLAQVQNWLAGQPNIRVLYIPYDALLQDPQTHIRAVADFLGLPLDIPAMLAVPDKNLHRQRS
ncbi:MAG: sulfotransferase [Chloroflexota bacterium]